MAEKACGEQGYRTAAEYAEDSFVERRSKFIGAVMPCKTEAEALAFIEKKKKQHWDAAHNVYAYIIRENGVRRCSDDGEPQGTAGKPVLDVLEKEGLTDICMVATRYFGGIMLGAGGLVRAYSHTSKIAVDAAGIRSMFPCENWTLSFDYSLYGKISYILPDYPLVVKYSDFGANVVLSLTVREDACETLRKKLTEITNGSLKPEITGKCFADIS